MITLPSSNLPPKNKLRIFIFLLGKSILFFPIVVALKKYLLPHTSDCSVLPGIFSYYGKVRANKCMLSNTLFIDYAEISIGENTTFGFDCMIITSKHDENVFTNIKIAPVTIGSNCYIGSRSMIFPGITIGNNCIIGAGAVVTHDVLDGQFVAGVPAKPIFKELT